MGFSQPLSGLSAQSQNLDVISNNIANSQTVGFKGGNALFADVFAGANSKVGLGTTVSAVRQDFGSGDIESTGRGLDLAIAGDGFFRLEEPNGETVYSRNGQFSQDAEGFLVNATGQRLTGYGLSGTEIEESESEPLRIPQGGIPASATTQASAVYNLNADATPGENLQGSTVFTDANDKTQTETVQYHFSSSFTVFDSLGNDHVVTQYFEKINNPGSENFWNLKTAFDGVKTNNDNSYNLSFNQNGELNKSTKVTDGNEDSLSFQGGSIVSGPTGSDSLTLPATNGPVTVNGNDILDGNDVSTGNNVRVENGRLVDGQGKDVVVKGGKLVDSNGKSLVVDNGSSDNVLVEGGGTVDRDGRSVVVDGNGELVVQGGNVAVRGENLVDDNGNNIVNQNRSLVDGNGDVSIQDGKLVDSNGNIITGDAGDIEVQNGRLVDGTDNVVITAGVLKDGAGNDLLDGNGNVVEVKGRNLLDASGDKLVDGNGEDVLLQGGNIVVQGENISIQGGKIGNGTSGNIVDVNDNQFRVENGNIITPGELTFGAGEYGFVGASDLKVFQDLDGTTQFASSSTQNSLTQNGYTSGNLAGIEVLNDGTVQQNFTNGEDFAAGKIVLASFVNQQGLQPEGDNNFSATRASGEPAIGTPGSGLLGNIEAGAVENSNVDLASELVDTIIAQRAYQANSTSISTQDELLQTVIQLG